MKYAVLASFALAVSIFSANASATAIDPFAYPSLGDVTLSGSIAADTDTLRLGGLTGILEDGTAVFDFDDLTVNGNIVGSGSHPLALLSRTDITIAASGSLSLGPRSDLILAAADSINILGTVTAGTVDISAATLNGSADGVPNAPNGTIILTGGGIISTGPGGGIISSGPGTILLTPAPEPATTCLLLTGLLGSLAARVFGRRLIGPASPA